MQGYTVEESPVAFSSLRGEASAMVGVRHGHFIPHTDLTHCLRKSYFRRWDYSAPDDTKVIEYLTQWRRDQAQVQLGYTEGKRGVLFTSDFEVVDNGEDCPGLIKVTRLGANNPNILTLGWAQELAALCCARAVTVGFMAVVHVKGDYREDKIASARYLRFEFEPETLEGAMRWLEERREILFESVQAEAPPEVHDITWECGACVFKGHCKGLDGHPFGVQDA